MLSTQIDKVLSLYKRFYQIPSLTSLRIVPVKNGITVQSIWAERNFERNSKQKFLRQFNLNTELSSISASFPVEISSELLTATSENEELKGILRDVTVEGKSKQFIEIWDQQHLCKSYDLSAIDVHGDVYADTTFSAFQWSPDNKRLLYVAEKKLPKNEPFYKQKAKPKTNADKADGEEEPSKGTEYIYKPDWGEQLVGKHRSVVVVLNIENDTIEPVDIIPNEYFPAQVIWAPNGVDIVGIAFKLKTRYLGLYACTNRESYIFHLKDKEFRKLTAEGLSCRAPRFSPDGRNLIWLERDVSPAHHHVHRLMRLKWDTIEIQKVLVDLVKTNIDIEAGKKFYGFYNESLPLRCWSDDSKYIFLSTPQRSNIKSYIIDLEKKALIEIEVSNGSSSIVADVKQNYVAFAKFSLTKPPQFVIGKFNPEATNIGNLNLVDCTTPDINDPDINDLTYEHTEYTYDNNDTVKDFNFTYFGKKGGPNQSMPLIVVPHGGPHVSHCNMYSSGYMLFATLGFGILQINYRGSTGLGGDNVDYLLGKVGKTDVIDCITAIEEALKKYPWIDPKRVNVYGGSHGGFLGAHLTGQYSDKFKTAVLRNPVIDIAAMHAITDIPDWCRAESGFSILEKIPEVDGDVSYSELVQKMLQHSPILYVNNVKAPTLVVLGSKDLRVPLSQGKLWYNLLVTNNVITKLFVYEDNHSLAKDEVEIDNVINTALWLLEHNSE